MRILHFFKTYMPDSWGGTQSFIYQLAEGTAREGHDVDVLFLSRSLPSQPQTFGNHTIHPVRLTFELASTGFSIPAFKKFNELARQADIVHYHFPWPFMDVVHFAARASKPSIVTYHSDVVRQRYALKVYRPLQFRFLSAVDRIVATSPNYLATSKVLQQFAPKTTVIPIGLDYTLYPKASDATINRWRSSLGDQFFLFVGMLRYYKGLHILLEAAKDTQLFIVIVGAGPTERELREQAKQLNLSNVLFLGEISEEDKVALLILCLAVVFPSHLRSEAFGITLLEGAMFGKPMISSEIGTGTTYVNIGGETGLVVPPSDPHALRRAMNYLVEHPAQAQRMGQNARLRYQALFTSEIMVSKYLTLYQEVLSKRRANDKA
ncbi:glycosyl transferase family 1 [Bradyrhizobium sp. CCBAU 53340]|uniref:glycosyltransferase family 4 protein n=1 Tax=Bradyrhizobium sp. CCBAU 53340 TaxID=1325112 RepID=UPI00188A9DC8|nr:glycosyltransferase family 4 protein [Bradyrhizobium sp. CCBAU 53340]QOZ43981.1 glycosyl transferase family 1 [Bradyrhizobium sp. CCBAU 53340]